MSSIWMKSAALIASAALLPLAVVPAFAQRESVETQEKVTVVERQSKPTETEGTPQELRLRNDAAAGICITKAETQDEAEENCTAQLQCQPPAAPNCKKRGNLDDWRCTCK